MVRAAIVLLLLILMPSVAVAQAENRIALVIGNKAYSEAVGPLKNPHNDITLMEKALREVGFQLLKPLKDASRDDTLNAVYELAERLRSAGGSAIGFLYYSGHGVAVSGENLLVPVNAEGTSDRALAVRGVRLADVIDILKSNAPDAVLFIVLDACRNTLHGQRGAKGFVPVNDRRTGVVLAFATAAGETASDGDGSYGPYATALADELVKPGHDDQAIFNAVRRRVVQSTRGQTPWTHDGLVGERVVFKAVKTDATISAPQRAPNGPTYEQQAELTFWSTVKDSKDPAVLQVYLDKYPSGTFADLARQLIAQAKRESEARQAEAAERAAQVQRAEAERKARDAQTTKQQDELRRALEEARLAREALKAAEADRRAAEKAAQEARRSAEAAAAALPAPKSAPSSNPPPPTTQANSAASGQKAELEAKRQSTPTEAERAWAAVKDSTEQSVLEAYVKRFGDTLYGSMARARITELKKQVAEARAQAEAQAKRQREESIAAEKRAAEEAKRQADERKRAERWAAAAQDCDQQQDNNRSIKGCTELIQQNPRTASAYFNRGNSHGAKKDYDLAISDYTRAIEIDPKYAPAYNNRGNAYSQKKEYYMAIADFIKAIEIDPKHKLAYANRGWIYERLGRRDEAIADLRTALSIDPSNQPYKEALMRLEQSQRVSLPPPSSSQTYVTTKTDGLVTFKFRNATDSIIHVRFYASEYNLVWPNASEVFVLNEHKSYSFPLNCKMGVNVCFGGAHPGISNQGWGVGLDGKQRCNDCCLTCGRRGDNTNHSWNLTQ